MKSPGPSLITRDTILLNLQARSKHDAIRSLCGHLFILNKTENPSLLYQDIIKREQVVSTFAGSRTAIPHTITRHIAEPVLCFARISNEDLTWDGNDESVRFVLLLAAPAQEDLTQLRQSQSYVFSAIAQLISEGDALEIWETTRDEQVILDNLNNAFESYQNTKTI
jgi:PTS system fructose-specific IIA component